jgi:FKBP-type peptidyl-prolyl cis-trans isomerase
VSPRPRLFALVLATLVGVLVLGGCGRKPVHEGAATTTSSGNERTAPEWTEAELATLRAQFGETTATSSGLHYIVQAPGRGEATPPRGQTVAAHYTGRFLDGTVFDSSIPRGQPLRFPVGTGRVIKGWDEALLSMKAGERRTLIIPWWLAYGEAGMGGTIPPRATLVFDVELIGWEGAPPPEG